MKVKGFAAKGSIDRLHKTASGKHVYKILISTLFCKEKNSRNG